MLLLLHKPLKAVETFVLLHLFFLMLLLIHKPLKAVALIWAVLFNLVFLILLF